MRKAMAVTGAFALPLGLALAAAPAHAQDRPEVEADDSAVLHAQLQPLEGSSAAGTAMVEVEGTEVTVDIESTGLEPNVNAAQHFHVGGQEMCSPTSEDGEDGAEVTSRSEGASSYEPAVSLTTAGSTRTEDGLNLDSMPPANGEGEVSYHRTFEVQEEVADQLRNEEIAIVQNSIAPGGTDAHGSTRAGDDEAQDGNRHEAGGETTDEATEKTAQPGTCGALVAAPQNGMDTGFGGTAETGHSSAGVVGLGTAGMVGMGVGLIVVAGAAAVGGRLLWVSKA